MEHQFRNGFFRKLGYAVWFCMLIMALVFYKQRAFFMDGGFQLFNLVNEGSIQVYHYRFVTALPQVLPFILLKLSAPLWLLAVGFSASYILFYLLVYHLLVHYLKNEFLGWALVFLFTLISFDTFYHIQSEFYLGLALLLLVFGLILRWPFLDKKWMAFALLPLLIAVGFSHKLALVFFVFLWAFFWLNEKPLRHWRYVSVLGAMLAIAVVKSVWFTNWYEAAKQADFKNNWGHYFPNFLSLPSNAIFLERCLRFYYLLPILLLAVSLFYIHKRNWLKLAFVWAFFLGFLLLYNISDHLAPYRFYSEVTYLPLTIFVAVPFLFDLLPASVFLEQRNRLLLPTVFTIVIVLRLGTIYWNHHTFDRLFSWINTKLESGGTLGTNRLLLKSEDAPIDTVLMEWGVPFTAAMLSALEGPKAAKTLLILPDFGRYQEELERDDVFLSPFKPLGSSSLNPRYFDFGKGKYRMVEK